MPQGKLLDFIVSHRGIKANPEKITTITAIDVPRMIKDVQKLTSCMAALNKFISRLGEWGDPSSNCSSATTSSSGQRK
jgi:hypothetical protein